GFFMVERALERGDLQPGGLVVEPTAGNTGVSLAMAAAAMGLRFVAVMPARFSEEKAVCVRALGARVVRTDSAEGMVGAIARARQIAEEEGGWCPQQFSNPDNPLAHYETTGPEIWDQTGGQLDAFVAGVGSAGTFVGAGRFLREVCPGILLVAVQPQGSVLCGGEPGPHKVEGIGVDDIG
ncbi:cysteine synthase family protein, partial [bacterium]|nr:cysteine synthase family protein [bacterium]